MSFFKDLVAADRDIVINIDEFGDEHDIDGTVLKVVLEDEQIREADDAEALSESAVVMFAKTEELGYRKMRGETLYIDDVGYIVQKWLDEMGVTRVVLSLPESW